MTPYDMIKAHLDTAVPFANHVGVRLLEIGDGTASAELDQRPEVTNHINSMHAGAMFTLGEAASGAAMAGAIAPVILEMRPVAATGAIAYKKVAIGKLTAHAKTSLPGAEVMQILSQEGKVAFDVKCAACHGANATGLEGLAPPLVHKIYEPSHHGDEAFQRAVQYGVQAHHWRFGDMPPVAGLTRADVQGIVAYVRELQRENGIN